jgi:tetratricopeptide (TPR) repeat protein
MASASAAPSASAVASASVPSVPDGVNPKKEAERLLNIGKYKDAIPMAEAAIAADPEDAYPYLFLGAALQSVGRWKDGIAAYSKCVHTAKKGPVAECRAVGGH